MDTKHSLSPWVGKSNLTKQVYLTGKIATLTIGVNIISVMMLDKDLTICTTLIINLTRSLMITGV